MQIFEMEKKKRDDILKEEHSRRNSVIQDLNIDSQLAELEKLKKEKLDKEEKKKNITISAISKTLGKLNSIMVGDDSSDDGNDTPPPSINIQIQEEEEKIDISGN